MSGRHTPWELADDFPDTAARRAVVSVVRGFGALTRQMGPHYAKFGLTPPQFQLLTVLNRLREEQITQRRLAKELYVSFPNITAMLSRLEDAGSIERNINEADRREKLVRITRAGRALLRRIWRDQPDQLERVTAGLTDRERRELSRLLHKMIAGQTERSVDE
ncbi:MAG: MarR family transcriptional regulator [Pirellulaceae bacterium]|jgi:MarR family transcriptional regulator for hemolysin|nr:MarR family transcriptional regulator [Pirellulaceae bacterium]